MHWVWSAYSRSSRYFSIPLRSALESLGLDMYWSLLRATASCLRIEDSLCNIVRLRCCRTVNPDRSRCRVIQLRGNSRYGRWPVKKNIANIKRVNWDCEVTVSYLPAIYKHLLRVELPLLYLLDKAHDQESVACQSHRGDRVDSDDSSFYQTNRNQR